MDISSAFLSFERTWSQLPQNLLNYVFTWAMAAQLVAGGFAFLLAHKAAGAFRSWFERYMALSGLGEDLPTCGKPRLSLRSSAQSCVLSSWELHFAWRIVSIGPLKPSKSCCLCHSPCFLCDFSPPP